MLLPAWEGAVRAGRGAEVGVRLRAARAGHYRVALRAGPGPARAVAEITLAPAQRRTLWIPYRAAGARVRIDVAGPAGTRARAGQRLAHVGAARPLVALAESAGSVHAGVAIALPDEAQILRAPPSSLPRTAAAYDLADVLVLDAGGLRALAPAQAAALERHLARCGRVVLVAVPAPARARLRAAAGCGATLLAHSDGPAAIGARVADLLARAPPPLPDARTLARLSPAADTARLPAALVVFLAGYGLLFAALALARVRPELPLLAAAAASAIALAAWSGREPLTAAVLWSETHSGARAGRYVALVEVRGRGRGEAALAFPPDALPAGEAGGALPRTLPGGGAGHARVRLPAFLLSRSTLSLAGGYAGRPPLEIVDGARGPLVRNPAARASEPAVLLWRGRSYRVPAVAAGGAWRPDSAAGTEAPPRSASERLAARRSPDAPALLLAHTPAPLSGVPGRGTARSFVLVRARPAGDPRP